MRFVIVALALGLVLVSAAGAQESEESAPTISVARVGEGKLSFSFAAEGTTFPELLKVWNEVTGNCFFHYENMFRGKKFCAQGKVTLDEAQVHRFFQTLLVHNGFCLIPVGPPDGKAFVVSQIDQSRQLKQSATWVAADDVPKLAERPGEVFMTSITLQHVPVSQVREAVNLILANRNAEFAHEVAGSNSVLIVGFGSTLANIHALLQEMDKPSPLKLPEPPDEEGSEK